MENNFILDESSILTTNCFILKPLKNEEFNNALTLAYKFY